MNEIWKDIYGYEGYQISNAGNVRHIYKNKNGTIIKNLKNTVNGGGYVRIALYKNKKSVKTLVHRIVAAEFIQNPNNYSIINHLDGNKVNNTVQNLEWCTNSQNIKHAYRTGLSRRTKKIIRSDGIAFNSIIEASEAINADASSISCVLRKKCHTCKGYSFKFAIENGI